MNDSRQDTLEHIIRVRELLYIAQNKLEARGFAHDLSKLQEPEKSVFDACVPKLKEMAYGSDEYKAALSELKPALDHHYAANSHHPEHYQTQVCIICFAEYPADYAANCKQCGNGQMSNEPNVGGMSLLDVLEMLCDWKAATERMKGGGDIRRSLEINTERFRLSPQLASILGNTIREMGW